MAGNSNSGKHKAKIWHDALNYEANIIDKATGLKQIQLAAQQLMMKCLAGDIPALKEFGDRLDGKPPQEQQIDINETKTVIRSPAPGTTTDAWQQKLLMASNTTSSGNPSQGHKLSS